MPFWKKKQAPPREKTPEELAAELQALPGTLPCSEDGCTATTGMPCVYIDRRLRRCHTAWCPEHRAVAALQVYCRRHAGIVNALPVQNPALGETMPFPDLENRAPSLVAWVARQLDQDIWRIMLRELDAVGGGQLLADPVSLVFVGVDRQRAWERAWKLATHEGDKRRVSVLVEEANDDHICVKVGATVVERLQPPWITHRLHRETVPAAQDAAERVEFNERLLAAVHAGLERERALAGRYSTDETAPAVHASSTSPDSAS